MIWETSKEDFEKVEPIRFDEVNISRSFYDAG